MESNSSLSSSGESCRASLEALVTSSARETSSWASELLTRYDFWASEAGLFFAGKQSLDHQVRNNAKVRAMVQQFLEAISVDAALCTAIPTTRPMTSLITHFRQRSC
jgi:hypothetical protein